MPSSPSSPAPVTSAADISPADAAVIRPLGDAGTTSRFLLVVRTAGSGTQSVPFTATRTQGMPATGPVVVGSAEVAGDGQAEVFVLLDGGCCTQFWTIFRLVDGHLAQVNLSGRPVELPVGGTVAGSSGFKRTTTHGAVLLKYTGVSCGDLPEYAA